MRPFEDMDKDFDAHRVEFPEPPKPDCPKGFRLSANGIEHSVDDKEGQPEWKWLCSPIRVLALPRGADGKGWGRLVEITDPDGNKHLWAIPAELFAGDGIELRREAMRLGLRLSTAGKAKSAFSHLLQMWTPDARATTTERLGWSDATCRAFILGTGATLGGSDVVFQSEHVRSSAAEMHVKGTVEDWRDSVASLCIGNPLAVMAVSVALSGPLLEPMQQEGGGFHLRGESSRGKSTLLRLAASVWGAPGFVQSWRATSNGLEGAAACCNGSVIILDEMSEIAAKEAGATVYMLANGKGKARAGRAGNARPVTTWRTALLSSGEVSLADRVSEAGQKARAGQDVRLIDIKADARAFGCFDDLHDTKDGAAFSAALSKAAATVYGTAGPAFVGVMMQDMTAITATARDIQSGFVEMMVSEIAPDADGQVKRAFGRIGLAVAAGEMATVAGLTGWTEGTATAAGRIVARLWLDGRGGSGSQEAKEAVDRTRAFLVAHGDSRFVDLDPAADAPRTVTHNRAGWKQGPRYYIAADAWRDIHRGADAANAAKAVRDAGHLVTEPDRLTHRAPRGADGRPRCYCVEADIMGGDHE